MKYCEKCGKEIIDENMGCTECNKPEVELNDENIPIEENSLHNDVYFQLIKNAKITNIIGLALLPIAILFAFIFNGFSGAFLCLVAELVALLPKTKIQNKFKKENKNRTDKKQMKAEFKSLNKDLKSKSASYKMSFIIALVALALLISSFGIDSLKTVNNIDNQTSTNIEAETDDTGDYNEAETTADKQNEEKVINTLDYVPDFKEFKEMVKSNPTTSHLVSNTFMNESENLDYLVLGNFTDYSGDKVNSTLAEMDKRGRGIMLISSKSELTLNDLLLIIDLYLQDVPTYPGESVHSEIEEKIHSGTPFSVKYGHGTNSKFELGGIYFETTYEVCTDGTTTITIIVFPRTTTLS